MPRAGKLRIAPFLLFLAILAAAATASTASSGTSSNAHKAEAKASSAAPPGYRIASSISMPSAPGAPTTRIEVLEDQRLTPEIRQEWQGADAAMSCAEPPEDPGVAQLCSSITAQPLRGAQVRLISDQGGVLDHRSFERELADISQVSLYGADRLVFAVTVDYSIGFGSYAGPTTVFVEPGGGRFQWLAAFEPNSDTPMEVTLGSAFKSGWRTVPRAGAPGLDILAVRCHPEMGEEPSRGLGGRALPFVVIYERYTFDGTRWLRTERREPGFWEAEQGFPAQEKFPP